MKFQTFPLTDDGLKALQEASEIYQLMFLSAVSPTMVLAGFMKPYNSTQDPIAASSASPITAIPKPV